MVVQCTPQACFSFLCYQYLNCFKPDLLQRYIFWDWVFSGGQIFFNMEYLYFSPILLGPRTNQYWLFSKTFFFDFSDCQAICCAAIITMISLTWIDWFTNRFRGFFILFAEISQILLKSYFLPILLTFMNLVAIYQKTVL